MSVYPISMVARLSDINPETLRAWERRYGVVSPTRQANGRRLYSRDDVSRLKLINRLVKNGHKIGVISALDDQELEALAGPEIQGTQSVDFTDFIDGFINALKYYRLEQCENLIGTAMISSRPVIFFEEFLFPLLREIGEQWVGGYLSIDQEHLASSLIKRVLLTRAHTSINQTRGPSIAFATLENERHEFGLIVASFIAAQSGLRTHFLGTEIPNDDLVKAMKSLGASALALSVVQTINIEADRRRIEELRSRLPRSCEIWLGGNCAGELINTLPPENTRHIPSIVELSDLVEALV